jgi:hypothetical protein
MLAFIHMRKAGGKTINRVLRREYGLRHCDVEPWDRSRVFMSADLQRLKRLYPRLVSISGHSVRPHSDLEQVEPGIRYFTMLRHPHERCAAVYNFQVVLKGTEESFEESIRAPRYQNRQTFYLSGTQDADAAIEIVRRKLFFVGLSERYDESMLLLQKLSGDDRLRTDYPRYEVGGRGRLARLLLGDPRYKSFPDDRIAKQILSDPKRRRLLEEANRGDLKLFEFVRSEIFPQQIRTYGASFGADLDEFRKLPERRIFSANWLLNRAKRNLAYKPALKAYRRIEA